MDRRFVIKSMSAAIVFSMGPGDLNAGLLMTTGGAQGESRRSST